jgi:hypothetical protein
MTEEGRCRDCPILRHRSVRSHLGGKAAPQLVSWREAGRHFAVCERIMRRRPRWFVFWGPVTRMYWAFPGFETLDWLWAVCDVDPVALIARIDEVERLFGHGPTGKGGDRA